MEAEETKKRWKEYREELYKRELAIHDDVVSHPEPDMLECEVKQARGSTAVSKASGCNGIPVELFITLRDDALKCCTQYVSKSARPSRGPRTGRGQFSTQFPRRAVLKNVHTIGQLHSSPMQMLRLDLEKAEEPEANVPTST